MRDLETIATALTAAETGHLVFATLHTKDAPQTIDRIIDVFPPAQQDQIRAQLAIGLQGVVTQQLVPTADGNGRCVAAEVLVPTVGRPQPHPRGQDPPDLLTHPDGGSVRHADDGRLARGPGPREPDLARRRRVALVRAGRDAQARARRGPADRRTRRVRPPRAPPPRRRWPPDGRRDLHLQGGRRLRDPVHGRDRRRDQGGRRRRAQGAWPHGHAAQGEEVRPRAPS